MTAPGVSGWFPTSPCTPACLPVPVPDDGWPRLRRRVRTTARLIALAVVLLAGVPVALLAPLLGPALVGRVQALWCGRLLAAAGVRTVVTGPRPAPGSLVVANHVSWLDVLALNQVSPVRMLAKAEVRDWPLIGPMAARAGTVFLERDRLRALPDAVAAVAGALRAGGSVGVFAEGTTRCGRDLGRFRPAAFQAALDAGAPMVPVALAYADADGSPDASAAFVGDDDLLSSLIRVAGAPRTLLTVRVLPGWTGALEGGDLPGAEPARRGCARRAASAVTAALPTPDPDARPLPAVHAPAPPARVAETVRRSEVTRAA
ncbi:lysophospholipid acyltransferase family protein [Actinomycetospora termitidis]|uniref:Lysophospholipid acyltransferase family protein n=1 Tax=Actinomycetospora termitidis TaxID=3053470 RepID=A0ABT7MB37_9PSEU|nr:lysophospholipid acyltransferase family protein [Actinomycetospora sp. Odt1-22]MDL5157880.1 lysophospholipid acyltransferase family protein [Actinomycetospora sp. Odt1-22]